MKYIDMKWYSIKDCLPPWEKDVVVRIDFEAFVWNCTAYISFDKKEFNESNNKGFFFPSVK